jgi:hypothetical protein
MILELSVRGFEELGEKEMILVPNRNASRLPVFLRFISYVVSAINILKQASSWE